MKTPQLTERLPATWSARAPSRNHVDCGNVFRCVCQKSMQIDFPCLLNQNRRLKEGAAVLQNKPFQLGSSMLYGQSCVVF